MIYLQLVGGIAVLLGSAEVFIRGAVGFAKMINVPPLVIGMTVVALGTSAPELMVTLDAALTGAPGLAVGNVIGSNIANVLLILGVSCMLSPMLGPQNVLFRDGAVLISGTLVFALLCAQGQLGLWSGAVLFVVFLGFLASSYRKETQDDNAIAEHILEVEGLQPMASPGWAVLLAIIIGLAGVVWGADLLVEAAVSIARENEISEEVIGLTVVALGTSLPELAASVVAAYRGHSDIAVGNVVGSNLFNILGIAGFVAMVTPLPVSKEILSFDIWVMVGSTVLVLPILAGRWRPGRFSGALFLVLYGAFLLFNGYRAGLFGLG
ncbi:MAG: calcium/sodium antiporter [Rhodospirillales bacterium]